MSLRNISYFAQLKYGSIVPDSEMTRSEDETLEDLQHQEDWVQPESEAFDMSSILPTTIIDENMLYL